MLKRLLLAVKKRFIKSTNLSDFSKQQSLRNRAFFQIHVSRKNKRGIQVVIPSLQGFLLNSSLMSMSWLTLVAIPSLQGFLLDLNKLQACRNRLVAIPSLQGFLSDRTVVSISCNGTCRNPFVAGLSFRLRLLWKEILL